MPLPLLVEQNDQASFEAALQLNDIDATTCTKIEKDFLRVLMGGCTTPISALAVLENDTVLFRGNILSLDGKQKAEIEKKVPLTAVDNLGELCAKELLANGGQQIIELIRNAR